MNQPGISPRADSKASVSALVGGTIISVSAFAASFLLRLLGYTAIADVAGVAGVVVLLATPVSGLVATSIELRRARRSYWVLAIVVLGVLATAAVLAFAMRT